MRIIHNDLLDNKTDPLTHRATPTCLVNVIAKALTSANLQEHEQAYNDLRDMQMALVDQIFFASSLGEILRHTQDGNLVAEQSQIHELIYTLSSFCHSLSGLDASMLEHRLFADRFTMGYRATKNDTDNETKDDADTKPDTDKDN